MEAENTCCHCCQSCPWSYPGPSPGQGTYSISWDFRNLLVVNFGELQRSLYEDSFRRHRETSSLSQEHIQPQAQTAFALALIMSNI
jgi:hypothetical protein